MAQSDVRELIHYLVEPLVDEPDEIQIVEDGDGRYRLALDPDDVGRVIGRRGRTAKAIRTILRATGRYDLEIEDARE